MENVELDDAAGCVRLTDRNLNSTLWTMTTSISITPTSPVISEAHEPYITTLTNSTRRRWCTTPNVESQDVQRTYPGFYPINELVDINFRGREVVGLNYSDHHHQHSGVSRTSTPSPSPTV